MHVPVEAMARGAKKIAVVGVGGLAAAAALMAFRSGTANADVQEIGPGPTVTSRQASENSVIRINDFGVARGISEARLADAGVVSANGGLTGEVRDSVKAVIPRGNQAKPFRGGFPSGPAIGDW